MQPSGFWHIHAKTPHGIVTPEWLLCANKKGGSIMPLLVCSAMSCIYNKGEYCSKGDITVGGKEAEQPGETCCESFMARTGNGVTRAPAFPAPPSTWAVRPVTVSTTRVSAVPHRRSISTALLQNRRKKPSAELSIVTVENNLKKTC